MHPTDDWRSTATFNLQGIFNLIDGACLDGHTACVNPNQDFEANTRGNGHTPGSMRNDDCKSTWAGAHGGCGYMGKTTCRIRVTGQYPNSQMLATLKTALKKTIEFSSRDSQETFTHCTYWWPFECATYPDGVQHSLPHMVAVTYFAPTLEADSPGLSGWMNYELECKDPVRVQPSCPGYLKWATDLAAITVPGGSAFGLVSVACDIVDTVNTGN
jgi:hypothetical protein